jgi:hypothetical protein
MWCVLVVCCTGGGGEHALLAELRALRLCHEKVLQRQEEMENARMARVATPTPTHRGQQLVDALTKLGSILIADPAPGDPVMSAEVYTEFKTRVAGKHENVLSAALTPLLTALVPRGLVLSNTVHYQWLPPSDEAPPQFWRKPDLLVAHPGAIKRRLAPDTAVLDEQKAYCEGKHVFGGLDDPVHTSVYLNSVWEGKNNLGNGHKAVGELADYISCVGVRDRTLLGVLYDIKSFWLLECSNTFISKIIKCKWTTPGSLERLRAALDDERWRTPECTALLEAERLLKVSCAFEAGASASALLGIGGYGRVFRVLEDGSGQDGALKVVVSPDSADPALRAEVEMLQAACKAGCKVATVVADPVSLSAGSAAYLLREVGTRFRGATLDDQQSAVKALCSLHQRGFVHGDARVPNVLRHNGALMWVDMRSSYVCDEGAAGALTRREADLRTLLLSMLGGTLLPDKLMVALKYSANDASDTVCDRVCRALQPQP